MYIDRLVTVQLLVTYRARGSSSAIKNCHDVIILWACPILTCQLLVHVNFEHSYCPDMHMRLFSGIDGILRPDYIQAGGLLHSIFLFFYNELYLKTLEKEPMHYRDS